MASGRRAAWPAGHCDPGGVRRRRLQLRRAGGRPGGTRGRTVRRPVPCQRGARGDGAAGQPRRGRPEEIPARHCVRLDATSSADGWQLDGRKSFVLDGHTAHLILVVARSGDGLSLFAVPADASGLARTVLPTLDQTRKLARLDFAAVPATLLGSAGDGAAVLSRVLDVAAIAQAAEQLGGAQRALDMAVEYAKLRYQFGRPIGSFQAIKTAAPTC